MNEIDNNMIKCKICGKDFGFSEKITVNDLLKRMNKADAQKLLETRDNLQAKIDGLIAIGKTKDLIILQKELDNIERIIVKSTNGNSKEAYEYYGFTNTPVRCPSCRMKNRNQEIIRCRTNRNEALKRFPTETDEEYLSRHK